MDNLKGIIRPKGVSHQQTAPSLEFNNVSVAYAAGSSTDLTLKRDQIGRDRFALENINFQVSTGQRIAIVGPNGAGKSTLFKLIVGTVKPSSGSVHIYGHGPVGHTCIAYVPQRNQIDWSFPLTVKEAVMMGRVNQIGLFRWPRQRDWDIVHNCLERVNASLLVDKQIGELSGGQQQRIFVARALAQEAEVLLMDEPLSGLDVPSREAIFEILDFLREDGVTVLVATHDLSLAAEKFDRIMLLNQRIIAFGIPTDVLKPENLLLAYGGHYFNK